MRLRFVLTYQFSALALYGKIDNINMPRRIQFANGNAIEYIYTTDGQKLRTIYYTASTQQKDSTEYFFGGLLTKKNNNLDKYLFDGGYYSFDNNTPTCHYYNRDHLGNIREVISQTGDIEQVTHYYPFGAPYSDSSVTNPALQPYKYNSKEFYATHKLFTYDYGARQYDPLLTVWHGVDPLCEKDYGTGTNVYCRNNPVKFVDTDGKIIIFINGKIGWGAPYAGSTYWNGINSRFVNGAKNFFNDQNIFFSSEDYGYFSSAAERTKEGYEYGKKHYHEWKSNMKDNESFKFVSHSMGGAFSKGIENYIKEQGENVEYNLMINTYQVDKIKNPRDSKTFYIDYQNSNDPVLLLFDSNMGKGRLENSNLEIREKSNEKFIYIHKSPINSEEIWDTIKKSLRKK